MDVRHLYAVGFGLALVGTLLTAASVLLAGEMGIAVIILAATIPMVMGLSEYRGKKPFDLEPTLTYRVANLGGALVVVAIGLLMVAVGVASAGFFV